MYSKTLRSYYRLFENTPISAAILDVEGFKVNMANEEVLDFWGKERAVVGSPLLDFLPEIVGQRYPNYLLEVATTGKTIREKGARVLLQRNGKTESIFMDYSYSPIYGDKHSPIAILILATDVCEREFNRLTTQQSSRDLRTLVMSAPVPMCIFKGTELRLEAINQYMLDLMQGVPNISRNALSYVMEHRVPYAAVENGISYSFTPLGCYESGSQGVCVVANAL